MLITHVTLKKEDEELRKNNKTINKPKSDYLK